MLHLMTMGFSSQDHQAKRGVAISVWESPVKVPIYFYRVFAGTAGSQHLQGGAWEQGQAAAAKVDELACWCLLAWWHNPGQLWNRSLWLRHIQEACADDSPPSLMPPGRRHRPHRNLSSHTEVGRGGDPSTRY